jgi:hypothetical protein
MAVFTVFPDVPSILSFGLVQSESQCGTISPFYGHASPVGSIRESAKTNSQNELDEKQDVRFLKSQTWSLAQPFPDNHDDVIGRGKM